MTRIKVGVIGCGLIAQVMHLPYLRELDDQFEIAALCDVSLGLVDALGRDYGVSRLFTDHRRMLDQADLDAVLVLTLHHAGPAIDAARAGKHVFVEKPMVVNLEEADELIEVSRLQGVKVMVGYMKRYDPGYLAGLREIAPVREQVTLIDLHVVHGPVDSLVTHHKVRRFDDVPRDVLDRGAADMGRAVRQAIGDVPDYVARGYQTILGSSSHDVTILRAAFGHPEAVLSSEIWDEGFAYTVTMRYPNQQRCVFYRGRTAMARFEERLTAYAPDRFVEVSFPNPFLKSAPTLVTVRRQQDGSARDETIVASYEESFQEELRHFHECIVADRQPRTNAVEARKDTELMIEWVRAYLARLNR